ALLIEKTAPTGVVCGEANAEAITQAATADTVRAGTFMAGTFTEIGNDSPHRRPVRPRHPRALPRGDRAACRGVRPKERNWRTDPAPPGAAPRRRLRSVGSIAESR